MPVPDYDNMLVGQYIRGIENPDSLGFRNGLWFKSPRNVEMISGTVLLIRFPA